MSKFIKIYPEWYNHTTLSNYTDKNPTYINTNAITYIKFFDDHARIDIKDGEFSYKVVGEDALQKLKSDIESNREEE